MILLCKHGVHTKFFHFEFYMQKRTSFIDFVVEFFFIFLIFETHNRNMFLLHVQNLKQKYVFVVNFVCKNMIAF